MPAADTPSILLATTVLHLFSLALPATPLRAQTAAVIEATRLADEGRRASGRGEHAEAARLLARAAELRTGHPALLYRLAGAYAQGGSAERAVETLRQAAEMGFAAEPCADPAFTPARGAALDTVCERFRENLRRTGNSTLAFGLAQPDLIPEGIAFDPVRARFLVSSVRHGSIRAVDTAGAETEFAAPSVAGGWSALGMAVDVSRRRLWVATSALRERAGIDSAEVGQAALLALDLDSGQRLARYPVSGPGRRLLGDVCVSRTGDVFASDAAGRQVFRLPPGGERLQPLFADGTLLSPQGLALSPDERRLYVADYALGILVLDLASGEVRPLQQPARSSLLGIDGLAAHGGTLLAIQNGSRPHRVLRLHLSPDGLGAERVELLEANHPLFGEPTLGVVVGERFYYIANSQWDRFRDGVLQTDPPLAAPRILATPLPSSLP